MSKWQVLNYAPVLAMAEKVQRRQFRTARRTMLRFFRDKGWFQFADRLDTLKKDSGLNASQKRKQFQRILDDYARESTKNAEATPAAVTAGADEQTTGG